MVTPNRLQRVSRVLMTSAPWLLFVIGALLLGACNDSGLTLPTDASLFLTLNPQAVTLDPTGEVTEAVVEVQVQTIDLSGTPLEGVTVFLNTSSGLLLATELETDSRGRAVTSLTVTAADAGEVNLSAQSAAVQETATLTVFVLGAQTPIASLFTVPLNEQDANLPVRFDGSLSSEPDGPITCYQWEILSDVLGSNEIVQGPSVTTLDRIYSVEQNLTVFLNVSDDAEVGADCIAGGTPVSKSQFNGTSTQTSYRINCQNASPIASAGTDLTVPFENPSTVPLSGSTSSDSNGPIEKYEWICGNGQPAIVTDPSQPWNASCDFTAAGSYTATLTVWDQGDGTLDPGNGAVGDWNCQKQHSDTVTVTVFVP